MGGRRTSARRQHCSLAAASAQGKHWCSSMRPSPAILCPPLAKRAAKSRGCDTGARRWGLSSNNRHTDSAPMLPHLCKCPRRCEAQLWRAMWRGRCSATARSITAGQGGGRQRPWRPLPSSDLLLVPHQVSKFSVVTGSFCSCNARVQQGRNPTDSHIRPRLMLCCCIDGA
jgi:hypothetical protein